MNFLRKIEDAISDTIYREYQNSSKNINFCYLTQGFNGTFFCKYSVGFEEYSHNYQEKRIFEHINIIDLIINKYKLTTYFDIKRHCTSEILQGKYAIGIKLKKEYEDKEDMLIGYFRMQGIIK